MDTLRYVFAGNRFFVLEEMLKLGLDISNIFACKNSYLEKELIKRNIDFNLIDDKKSFINDLYNLDYDILISNGLPIKLPISRLTKNNTKKFINIHPSYLPDLRGSDPVPGAILFGRNSGATCHFMDDSLDTGDIISRVLIKNEDNFDVDFLYQLSFEAEKKVFLVSYKRNFEVSEKQAEKGNEIYYTFKDEDLILKLNETPLEIKRRVKAFNNSSKLAYFYIKKEKIIVYDIELFNSNEFDCLFQEKEDLTILMKYKNFVFFKKNGYFIKMKIDSEKMSFFTIGDILNID
ncbi:MAG TPA: formyltransferase family protein [Ignavibacteria bacterium]|nr:formyltransferase family protein [Ignavibacteria bacterium]